MKKMCWIRFIYLFLFFFTHHDRGRVWSIWKENPFICRTKAAVKMHQVFAQVLRAGFFRRRPFLEGSLEQVFGRQLPILIRFGFSQAHELEGRFPEGALLLPSDEALIEVQLCRKHHQLHPHWKHDGVLRCYLLLPLMFWLVGIWMYLAANSVICCCRCITPYW